MRSPWRRLAVATARGLSIRCHVFDHAVAAHRPGPPGGGRGNDHLGLACDHAHGESGQFNCPNCNVRRPYQRKKIQRFFTLYFSSRSSRCKVLQESIECQVCKKRYVPEVLDPRPRRRGRGQGVRPSMRRFAESEHFAGMADRRDADFHAFRRRYLCRLRGRNNHGRRSQARDRSVAPESPNPETDKPSPLPERSRTWIGR